jgi:excisionase family DNA binding protein
MKQQPIQSTPSLWRKSEAVEYLQTNVRTLDHWRRTAGLPCIKLGGSVRFRREDLDEWIAEHREAK